MIPRTPPVADASVRPFPFGALDALTRADVASAARLRRRAREVVDLEKITGALAELVEAPVTVTARRHHRLDAVDARRGVDDAIGVLIAPAGEHATSRRVLLEVEGALAAALAARALRQRAPKIVDPARPASPALAGAVAAIVIAALRRAHAGVAMKVLAAGPGADLARDLHLAERDVTTTTFSVVVGEDAFEARVSVPYDAAAGSAPKHAGLSYDALVAMGDATIALPLLLTSTAASRSDVAALSRGDVLVLESLGGRVLEDGSLSGAVALIASSSERGIAADLAENGRLVVRDRLESHSLEIAMPARQDSTTTIEALEDAPVVVRVELGAVEMTAREWAELGAGDVLALGRRIGDPAVLRVGGVELARGELVQVDGEYGVRILSRTPSRTGGE